MSGSLKDRRDYRGDRQDNMCELEAPPQQIQVYYGDDSRRHGSHWRTNHQHDFFDHTHGEHGYSHGQPPANYWNQSYNSWGAGGYSDQTYFFHDNYYAPYGYDDQYWDPDSYPYPNSVYLQQNFFGTPDYYEGPQPRESPCIETIPRSPSPSYLNTSLDSSKEIHPAPRKLVILDLNGTLLVRTRFPKHPHHGESSQPFKRTVLTRPFLASFREYLFHPDTKGWLDVMIWSSAQPHSVQDMLRRCFPIPKGAETTSVSQHFIAVWARDTLGLSSIDYSRKTQTIKDLRKPWGQLVPSDNDGLGRKHSALTTLLVDDSPHKACLQPWNHVCVSEYDAASRVTEVSANQATTADLQDVATDHQSTTPNSQDVARKPKDVTPNPQNIAPEPQAIESAASSIPTPPSDPTLLAVIGILEALRPQSNVAAWIRAGRLFPARSADGDVITESHRNAAIAADAQVGQLDELEAKEVIHMPSSPHKRRREADDVPDSAPAKRPKNEFSHSKAEQCVVSLPPSTIPPQLRAPKPAPLAISSASSSPVVHDLRRSPPVTPPDTKFNSSQSGPQWFEHAPTFAYWIAQGRAALRDLGIREVGRD